MDIYVVDNTGCIRDRIHGAQVVEWLERMP